MARMRTWRVGRTPRRLLELGPPEVEPDGSLRVGDLAAVRRIASRLNETGGAPTASAGEIVALGLLHEVAHLLIDRYESTVHPGAVRDALAAVDAAVGRRGVDRVLRRQGTEFGAEPDRAEAIESLYLLALAGENPAADPIRPVADPSPVASTVGYDRVVGLIDEALAAADGAGPDGESLAELLRAPARHAPGSLAAQLRYVRDRWASLLPADLLDRLLAGEDLLAEEARALHLRFGGGGGPGRGEAPSFAGGEAEPERFSEDREWMPRLVLLAKSTYVWLDQLSRTYGRDIRTLDAIPDEELDILARRGITGLWLIGLWQRSTASETIKRWRGNAEAVASAYSLDDYRIADDLGGEGALGNLRERAWARGIRLASDMVPNHMGLDSRWVIEHPDRFLSVAEPPFPSYRFEGKNLAGDERIEIRIDDHYWDDTDAAVVFERRDRASGERRYIYHGNDGTSFPWNDTAQLDYLKADVREAVIRTILDVAHRFPVIRFDAAMVLAKRHIQRLWFPEPGGGGAIPSRSEHAMSKAAFDALMPNEFWRDVVDRVAAEAPDTLLLAEAFWLMEGFFVRTLGMHRVYNSAFMHMLRDEDNAGYRKVIKDTIEFDPAILGRYVNFLTNPDEATAIEQFGTGDKAFGASTLLATMPGLPMIGHGQVEAFGEKYGMEFRRARQEEAPDEGHVAHFERAIVPLLRDRRRFAGSAGFRLYDVVGDDGGVREDVFAYSNGDGDDRSLVLFHNRYGDAAGWIRESATFAVKRAGGAKRQRRETLTNALGLSRGHGRWLRFRDSIRGEEYLRSVDELRDRGLHVQLGAYEHRVLVDFREVVATADTPWAELADRLGGGGTPSLDAALSALLNPASRPPDREERQLATASPRLDRITRLPDGRHLSVAEWGDPDGLPVFLLHGMPGSRLFAPDPMTTLQRGVRLITFDRPGYGGSDPLPGRTVAAGAADVFAVADDLRVDRFAVIGWSSGGPYALAAAARDPKRLLSVACVAGDAPPDEVLGARDEMSEAGRELMDAVRRGDPTARNRVAERFSWYATDPERIVRGASADPDDPDARLRARPEVRAALATMFGEGARRGVDGFVDDWIATMQPWGFELADVRATVAVWWGDRDTLTTRPYTDALVRLLPATRLQVVPDAGHLMAVSTWPEILGRALASG
jgi:pimeloyl-ACP methyl ester carboxylesterase/glycosidase